MTNQELVQNIKMYGNHPTVWALLKVVELHKPMEENCECNKEHIPTCEECIDDYPCPTIQAIEKDLK